jgi:hypothetical protein
MGIGGMSITPTMFKMSPVTQMFAPPSIKEEEHCRICTDDRLSLRRPKTWGEDSIQMIVVKFLIGVIVVSAKVVCACARLVVLYGKSEIVVGDEECGALMMGDNRAWWDVSVFGTMGVDWRMLGWWPGSCRAV